MAEQLLHRPDVVAGLQQVRGERMAQHMRRHWLVYLRQPGRLPHRMLHAGLIKMVAALDAAARISLRIRSSNFGESRETALASSREILGFPKTEVQRINSS